MSSNRISRRFGHESRSPSNSSYDSFSSGSDTRNRKKKNNRSSSSSSASSRKSSRSRRSRDAPLSSRVRLSSTSIGDNDDDDRDSFISDQSGNLSRANSFKNLEEEYTPLSTNLPFNVYQILLSVKESMIDFYKTKKLFQENQKKLKLTQDRDEKVQLKSASEKYSDKIIDLLAEVETLSEVIYGGSHEKYALACINLAQAYLEFKNLPKQAKSHCEKAWNILIENLKEDAKQKLQLEQLLQQQKEALARAAAEKEKDDEQVVVSNPDMAESNEQLSNTLELEQQHELVKNTLYPESEKHQMMLNYIYGRSCTLLKENEEGESALFKANQYLDDWQASMNKRQKRKYKQEIITWKQKIYLALAKQCAINGSNSDALTYYIFCSDLLTSSEDLDLLIETYIDRSRIEMNKMNYDTAVDIINDAIARCDKNERLINHCKLNLALVFSELDDMNSASKAEDLFQELISSYSAMNDGKCSEKEISVKEEFVKFYLKQEKYYEATSLLTTLIKEKLQYYGDFHPRLNSSYKLLCSVYLKRNDMISAAKYLQKSLELEEINYGPKDKRTESTRETLNNLKKNPSLATNIKVKKPFKSMVAKKNYQKEDKKLYKKMGDADSDDQQGKNETRLPNLDESSLSDKIKPLK